MSENGTEKRTNVWKEVAGQVSDHVDLASLELRYETQQAGKKLFAAAIIFILVLTGVYSSAGFRDRCLNEARTFSRSCRSGGKFCLFRFGGSGVSSVGTAG